MKIRNAFLLGAVTIIGAALVSKRGRVAVTNALVAPGETMFGSCVYVFLRHMSSDGVMFTVKSVMAPAIIPHFLYAEKTPENIEVLRHVKVLHFRPVGKPRRRVKGLRGTVDALVTMAKAIRHKGTWVEEPFEFHMQRMGWIEGPTIEEPGDSN